MLDSAIEATEESTRTGAMNEQTQTIRSVEKAKTQETQKMWENNKYRKGAV